MQTKDGYLMVGAAGGAVWVRGAKALGHPEWCADLRFATNHGRKFPAARRDKELTTSFNLIAADGTARHCFTLTIRRRSAKSGNIRLCYFVVHIWLQTKFPLCVGRFEDHGSGPLSS
jgi:hypothetical protein